MTTETILMTQKEAAQYLGTTVGTLNTWRHYGKDTIPFVRWGNRIRYRKEDLDTWIQSQIIQPTTTSINNFNYISTPICTCAKTKGIKK